MFSTLIIWRNKYFLLFILLNIIIISSCFSGEKLTRSEKSCHTDKDCKSGQKCLDNLCYVLCGDNFSCPSGLHCFGNYICVDDEISDHTSTSTANDAGNIFSADDNNIIALPCDGEPPLCGDYGICSFYIKQCVDGAWKNCDYFTLPLYEFVERSCDDGIDNDCDGLEDFYDGDCGIFTSTITCSLPAPSCGNKGVCATAFRVCKEGVYIACQPQTIAGYEYSEKTCNDNLDNDCDGAIDAEDSAKDSDCITTCADQAPSCANQKGVCFGSTQRCVEKEYVSCDYGKIPHFSGSSEQKFCSDTLDNDCDGFTDFEDSDCVVSLCSENRPLCDNQNGVCSGSLKICIGNEWKNCDYSSAVGFSGSTESAYCNDNLDNDCDALTDMSDNDCITTCSGSAPFCSNQTGVCSGSKKACNGTQWQECSYNSIIGYSGNSESGYCYDSLDNDCDGWVDSEDSDCFQCQHGETRPCDKTLGVCAGTLQSCVNGTWLSCQYPSSYELEEVSCDTLDNDCDGFTDEGLKNACQGCGSLSYGNPGAACNQCGQAICFHGNTICASTNAVKWNAQDGDRHVISNNECTAGNPDCKNSLMCPDISAVNACYPLNQDPCHGRCVKCWKVCNSQGYWEEDNWCKNAPSCLEVDPQAYLICKQCASVDACTINSWWDWYCDANKQPKACGGSGTCRYKTQFTSSYCSSNPSACPCPFQDLP